MNSEKCPLCQRPLGSVNVDKHHLIPKTFGGKKETTLMHKICHRKLHSCLTEREMLNYYHTIERLLENEDIMKFVKWVQTKSIDFYQKTKETRDRKQRRRR